MTKNFTQYLKDALIIKGRIQVPGLGTFSSKYQAAKIIEDNKMLPPDLIIEFSDKENISDENILNFMISESSVPKEVATKLLKEFIQYVKESLSVKRNAEIEGLGKIHYDSRKKLSFSSEKSDFYGKASGFKEHTAVVLNKKQIKAAQKVKAKKRKVKAAKTASDKKQEVPIKKKKKLWPVWLILILLIISVPIVSILMNKNKDEAGITQVISAKVISVWNDVASLSKSLKESNLLASNDSTANSDNNNENTKIDTEQVIQNTANDIVENNANTSFSDTANTFTLSNKKDTVSTISKKTVLKEKAKLEPKEEHFALSTVGGTKLKPEDIKAGTELYLIAGSFRSHKNALNLREQLIGMGFQAQVLASENGLNRVALGKFTDLKETLATYMRFHKKKPKIGVWLLVKR